MTFVDLQGQSRIGGFSENAIFSYIYAAVDKNLTDIARRAVFLR